MSVPLPVPVPENMSRTHSRKNYRARARAGARARKRTLMPLLWRYLLKQYIKVFVLCVLAFIAILITMRLEDIAYFATLGPNLKSVILYVFQQIPYILPIALPIAALISSILLMQRLSRAYELTAMRSLGFALRDILAPIVLASLFFSAVNFYIVSELSTTSHFNAGMLKNELRAVNPLLLLHNRHVMRMKGFYFDTLGASRIGEYAQDIVFLAPNRQSERLNLVLAKELQATPSFFKGSSVTLLTTQAENAQNENLMIENIQENKTATEDFSQILEKKMWTVNNDHLRLPLLLVRMDELSDSLKQERLSSNNDTIRQARHTYRASITEIFRRLSLAIAVFSFTLMGVAFGISITRNHSNKGIIFVIALGAFYMIAFFIAKNFDYALGIAASLYLVPHAIIIAISSWALYRTTYGVE